MMQEGERGEGRRERGPRFIEISLLPSAFSPQI